VRRTFLPIDAEVILKIKLSSRSTGDFLAWHPEKSGIFSVRSAYHLGLRFGQQAMSIGASSALPLGNKPIWKKIWKCNIPEKVRIFAWRAVSNSLATEGNKVRHHLPVSGLCRVCHAHPEDTYHAIMHCQHASTLWEAMREVWTIPKVSTPIHIDWLEVWLLSLPLNICERVLMIAWRIWYARNEVTHDKPLPVIVGSRRFICSYMQTLENIQYQTPEEMIKGKQCVDVAPTTRSSSRAKEQTLMVWSRPPLGTVKLNIDGAYMEQSGIAGAGMILRRDDGSIVFSACRVLHFCSSALESELAACLEGVTRALEASSEDMIIETDCLSPLGQEWQ
jgi:hypothetical protein